MELFNRIVTSIYRQFIPDIVCQSFYPLVLESFSRSSAKIPPTLPLKNITRPEDRVALMQVIKGLTEDTYLNPSNETDWAQVRNILDFNEREMTTQDKKFFKDMLITPRQKTSGSGSLNPSSRPRSLDNAVQGKGTGAGRPTGKSSARESPS
jgi:hypothetical protein